MFGRFGSDLVRLQSKVIVYIYTHYIIIWSLVTNVVALK